MKISGIYKITSIVTNECYVGSSKDVNHRCAQHKCPSTWKKYPNNSLYLDMQKYGLDKFSFEILEETTNLKEREQYYIGLLKPSYNDRRASGLDIERQKEYHKEYEQSEKYKEVKRKYNNQLCLYNGEKITLVTLAMRFHKVGIPNPVLEAKKYLLNK